MFLTSDFFQALMIKKNKGNIFKAIFYIFLKTNVEKMYFLNFKSELRHFLLPQEKFSKKENSKRGRCIKGFVMVIE